MKTPLIYGFAMALVSAVLTFVLFFAGFHSSAEKMQSAFAQTIGFVGPFIIGVTCLVLAMRERRANAPADAPWGYASALGTGVMTGLFASLIGIVFAYVYFAYINPQMSEVIYQVQAAKMEAKGMSADQIERAEPMMRKMMSPLMMTVFQTVVGFIWSVLLSLILAIFVRSRPTASIGSDAPPVLG
jgi:hypothetical protein